ncbi:hydantoinase/oxoprolinase N-terminal domain-containing protein [Litorihabitans aurantiacus]|uniref:Hydantoinase/oxoprolinase N-terminal domain-containing protein n=1 Tax=Litorihabitans aurantiacus TaxID=1930061 RepID=A0AA37XHE4_9MICO|nr:hydantoinase/oxoprolinase N-terminal domain-containing protein [Litorihabitans aurantiacus]GMA33164.1 hypothetical protein GCM10025875_31560 [Litorihabitans aurantiacus]
MPSGDRGDGATHDLTRVVAHKVASTPQDPAAAVEQGLRDLLGLGVAADDVAAITHGTTIGLNAILQRRVARVAVLTSLGHRDLVHIGRARLPRSFDLHARPPRPVVDRDQVVELDLRFAPDGAAVGAEVTPGSPPTTARWRRCGTPAPTPSPSAWSAGTPRPNGRPRSPPRWSATWACP